ncbi:MAG TPA: ABC transporter ATP-binding protein [Candidatus Deferrimicrobium sp.]|nr:ABC transporter ATP-binding protein [Candidatus Deferrimicrobium sp.]
MINDDSLLVHVKPFLFRFIFALVCMAMIALFTVMMPVVIEPLINELSLRSGGHVTNEGRAIRDFIMQLFVVDEKKLPSFLPFLLLFTFIGEAIFTFFSHYFMKTLGLKVVRDIRNKLYKNLILQSVGFLSKAKTGDLVSRISNDIEKINFAVSETLSVYVRESLTLLALLIYIFIRDWQMALISMLVLPVAAVPLIYFGKKVKKRGLQAQETIGELSNFLTETVAGNKIVKAYNMEQFEIDKFNSLNQRYYKINSRIAMVYSLAAPVMHSIGGLVAFVIFAVASKRIAVGTMDPGKFAGFFLALLIMYNPIKRLSQANNDYQQGKVGYERVLQIVNAGNTIKDIPSAMDYQTVKGEVHFENVSFSYETDLPVLKHVNFTARSNQMVALVGASGSGKTTLMNLLLRFYEPDSGEIRVDGHNILHLTLASLRNSISLVTQDVFLFNDTILNNITYGSKNFSFADVKKAAEIARAADFIEKLPDKYNSMVGERGVFLSTGQRQRISIARAILKKPSILIFDEATSSLDSESENLIQEAMEEVMKGRTTFVIAHRLSTIIQADKILVIQDGEIKESGNHQELLTKKGLYHSLYNLQFPEMNIIMKP